MVLETLVYLTFTNERVAYASSALDRPHSRRLDIGASSPRPLILKYWYHSDAQVTGYWVIGTLSYLRFCL